MRTILKVPLAPILLKFVQQTKLLTLFEYLELVKAV